MKAKLIALLLSVAVAIGSCGMAFGQPPRVAHGRDEGPTIDGAPADVLQRRIDAALAKARSATVRISTGVRDHCSGVIVTADGFIVSCAHHGLPPGSKGTVLLSDGRTTEVSTLGVDRRHDIGLFKIVAPGPWPFVEMGASAAMRPDDLCVATGQPVSWDVPGDSRLVGRLGRIVDSSAAPGRIVSSCWMRKGDSGGGLFDLEGRIIGIHSGSMTYGQARDVGIELFQRHWQSLVAGRNLELEPVPGPGPIATVLQDQADVARPFLVEVLCDQEPRSLGTIIDADGGILTKASELYGKVTCRFKGGRQLPAVACTVSHEYDLAYLRLDARNLPAIPGHRPRDPSPGDLVAAVGLCPDKDAVGIVTCPGREIPPLTAITGISVRQGPAGAEVTKLSDNSLMFWTLPFHVGDTVLEIEGAPVPDLQSYIRLTEKEGYFPGKIAGDRVRMTLLSEGRHVVVDYQLPGSLSPYREDIPPSARRSGFPSVISTDFLIAPDSCGGPVVDREGQVIGLTIARGADDISYFVPISIAREIWSHLRAAASEKGDLTSGTTALVQQKNLLRPARIGEPAPQFDVRTIDGKVFHTADAKGRQTILCFWRTDSGRCYREENDLIRLYKKEIEHRPDRRFLVLYLRTTEEEVKRYGQRFQLSFPQAWIGQDSPIRADYLTQHAPPCYVVIGPDGTIVLRSTTATRVQELLSQKAESE